MASQSHGSACRVGSIIVGSAPNRQPVRRAMRRQPLHQPSFPTIPPCTTSWSVSRPCSLPAPAPSTPCASTGDVLNAAVVALGIWLLLRYYPRRTPLVGVLLALSPMVLFLMAVLNSSGLEIVAGFAAWCGGLCVVTYLEVPRALAAWTAVAAILLVLSRPTSPLDLLIIVVVLAVYVGWRGLRERLNPSVRRLWIPVALALAVAALFLVIDGPPHLIGSPPRHPAGLLSNVATTVRLTGGYLEQCIGNFGVLNIPVPTWVTAVWTACLTALTAAALVLSAPCRRALPVVALAIVAMTIALEAPKINVVGTYFQGRYILPVVVGFPLVASSFEWRGRLLVPQRTLARSALVGGIVLFAAQLAAFNRTLQVYKSGQGILGQTSAWLPPGGEFPVQLVFVVGAIVTLAFVVFMMLPRVNIDPLPTPDLGGTGSPPPTIDGRSHLTGPLLLEEHATVRAALANARTCTF